MITANGVSPKELTIQVGGTVTFVNNDRIPHDMAGGPDPQHPDCPEIDAVGFLTPGQERATGPISARAHVRVSRSQLSLNDHERHDRHR